MFLRRLGENRRQQCLHGHNCPQILEMTDGDFAAAGLDNTNGSGQRDAAGGRESGQKPLGGVIQIHRKARRRRP